jgi:hypothetical protein
LLSLDNGLLVTAEVEDDGTPQPVTVRLDAGERTRHRDLRRAAQTTSGVTFSEAGSYVLRITATDGQFSVNDQIAVEVGPSLTPAGWIRQDLNPSSSRRGDTGIVNGVFTVTGTGSGYAGTSDGAHVITRQVSGNASLVARVTSLSGTGTPLTGSPPSATRCGWDREGPSSGCEPGNVVRFRTRTTASVADSSITAIGSPAAVAEARARRDDKRHHRFLLRRRLGLPGHLDPDRLTHRDHHGRGCLAGPHHDEQFDQFARDRRDRSGHPDTHTKRCRGPARR